MTPDNDGVDVIVRFHDLRRIGELQRAIFSLVGQDTRPIRILLVLQRFTDGETEAMREALAPLLSLPDAPDLTILRYDAAEPADARSALINLGFAAVTARYVAFLDYDDVLYPEAYRLLTGRLRESSSAIAFGQIVVKLVDVHERFLYAYGQTQPFRGRSLVDMFRQNFCPIHSFVLDRMRVPAEELHFERTMTIEEDYEFLLRVCARVESDFALVNTRVGEYYFKSDNSNTTAGRSVIPHATLMLTEAAAKFLDGRRGMTPLSEAVQRQLGLNVYRPGLTIRAFLEETSE